MVVAIVIVGGDYPSMPCYLWMWLHVAVFVTVSNVPYVSRPCYNAFHTLSSCSLSCVQPPPGSDDGYLPIACYSPMFSASLSSTMPACFPTMWCWSLQPASLPLTHTWVTCQLQTGVCTKDAVTSDDLLFTWQCLLHCQPSVICNNQLQVHIYPCNWFFTFYMIKWCTIISCTNFM